MDCTYGAFSLGRQPDLLVRVIQPQFYGHIQALFRESSSPLPYILSVCSFKYRRVDPGPHAQIRLLCRLSKTYSATEQPQARQGREHPRIQN